MADNTDPYAQYLRDPYEGYLNAPEQKPLENAKKDDLAKGALKGAATSTMLGLADYPGMLLGRPMTF